MGKKILVLVFLLFKIGTVFAVEHVAGGSAKIDKISGITPAERLSYASIVLETNRKRKAVLRVLKKYESPMASSVDSFIKTCRDYKINCYLLPSIAGLESRFGRYIYPNSYNPFGWGGGYIVFENWDSAIETVGRGLGQRYVARGATTVDQIGRIYAESPTWAVRVKSIMNEFESEEQKNQLSFSDFELQL